MSAITFFSPRLYVIKNTNSEFQDTLLNYNELQQV
jgi:hypothetical protein